MSTPSNGNSNNENVSPVGSPPLILAFLAIGIFSAAMVAVFGWRRVQFARDGHLWGYANMLRAEERRRDFASAAGNGGGPGGTGPKFGKKPVMWEAWTDRSGKVESADYGCWDNITPLAVLSVPRKSYNSPSIATQNSLPGSLPARRPLTSLEPPPLFQSQQTTRSRRRHRLYDITILSIFRRPTPPDTSIDISSNLADQEYPSQTDREDLKDAQVVVIIEMPSPTSPRCPHTQSLAQTKNPSRFSSLSQPDTLVDNNGQTREDLIGKGHDSGQFQYCLGIQSYPWPLSPAKSMTHNSSPAPMP